MAVEAAFQDMCRGNDREHKYTVDKTNFSAALDQVNIHLRAADVEGIFSVYSTDRRKAALDYRDFIDAVTSVTKNDDFGGSTSRSSPMRRIQSSPANSPGSRGRLDRK